MIYEFLAAIVVGGVALLTMALVFRAIMTWIDSRQKGTPPDW